MTQTDDKKYSEVSPSKEQAEKKEEEEENKLSTLSPQQLFYHHCRSGKLDELRKLFKEHKNEINVDGKDQKDERELGSYGGENSGIHYACQYGRLPVVKFLFEQQADLNCQNKLGNTPIIVASSNGRLETVKYLIQKEADTDIKNKIGNTPVHVAVFCGHVEITKLLLERADDKKQALETGNNSGMSPVKFASHPDMINFLRPFFPKQLKKDDLVDETNQTPQDNGVEEINDDEEEQEPIEMQQVTTNRETNEVDNDDMDTTEN